MIEPKVAHEWVEKYPDKTVGFVLGVNGDYIVDGQWMPGSGPSRELARVAVRMKELEAALDQYRADADEWKCPTCGEWQSDWQMYCDKPECRAAIEEKP